MTLKLEHGHMTTAELVAAKNPDNPRNITDHQYDALRKSIERWGFVEPVVYNTRTKQIVGGHQRVDAAESLGIESVDVILVDLSENEERALNIALNKISGDWDDEKLGTMIRELDDELSQMIGFQAAELEELMNTDVDIGRLGLGEEESEGFATGDQFKESESVTVELRMGRETYESAEFRQAISELVERFAISRKDRG